MNKLMRIMVLSSIISLGIMGCNRDISEGVVVEEQDELEKDDQEVIEPLEQQKIILNTISMFAENNPIYYYYQKGIDDFREDNPQVIVEDYSDEPNQQWYADVKTRLAIGEEVDVLFYSVGEQIETIIDKEDLVSIEEIRTVYPDYASHIDEEILAAAATSDGTQYAVPIQVFFQGVYCNVDLFEQYELELPTTWDEFNQVLEVFDEEGVIPIAVSIEERPEYFIEYIVTMLDYTVDMDQLNVLQDKKVWEQILTEIVDLKAKYSFLDNNFTHEEAIKAFEQKEAAMLIEGSWNKDRLLTEDVVIIPIPKPYSESTNPHKVIAEFTGGYYITRQAWEDASKRESAVRFVENMISVTMLEQIAMQTGAAPTSQTIEWILDQEQLAYKGSYNMLQLVPSMKYKMDLNEWYKIVGNVSEVLTGKQTINESVANIVY